MSTRIGHRRKREDISREESDLARRVASADRRAFDEFFDRHYARLRWSFRELPPAEARTAIREVMEQLFAALGTVDDVVLHSYRIACQQDARQQELPGID